MRGKGRRSEEGWVKEGNCRGKIRWSEGKIGGREEDGEKREKGEMG